MNNYQLPKFRPVTDTIQLPVGRHANDNGLSITHFRDRLGGVPYATQVNITIINRLLIEKSYECFLIIMHIPTNPHLKTFKMILG